MPSRVELSSKLWFGVRQRKIFMERNDIENLHYVHVLGRQYTCTDNEGLLGLPVLSLRQSFQSLLDGLGFAP